MYTKLISKILSCKNGNLKTLLFSHGRTSEPVKIYSCLRTASTAASEALVSDRTGGTRSPHTKNLSHQVYFRKYLLAQPAYRDLIFDDQNLNFDTEGRPECVQILQNLNNKDNNFEKTEVLGQLKASLLKEKEILEVDEICKSFFLINKYRTDPLAEEIRNILHGELYSRELSRPEVLKALFALRHTLGVRPRYGIQKRMSVRFSCRLHQLTREELVAFFYSVTRLGELTIKEVKGNVVKCLSEIMPSLDEVELGIIMCGLLNGDFVCSNYLLKKNLMKRATELSENMSEESLTYLYRLIHKRAKFVDGRSIWQLQESFVPYLSKFSDKMLINLTLIGINIGCINLNLWDKVAKLFKDNINNYDSLQILSITRALTEFGIQDEELLQLVIEWYERRVDDGKLVSTTEKKHLIVFLNNLVQHRVYSKKLFDVVYMEGVKYFKNFSGSDIERIKAIYWATKCTLDIDKPEFNYSSFTSREEEKLFKVCKFSILLREDFFSLISKAQKVRHCLLDLYGETDKVDIYNWHAMYPQGVIMRFDKNFNAQPIPDAYKQSNTQMPLKTLKDDHIWIFLLIHGKRFSHETETQKRRNLRLETQIRHLKAFGFNAVPVEEQEFIKHVKGKTQSEFIQNLVSNHLREAFTSK